MFRLMILLLALTLLPMPCIAEAPLTFAPDLTGVYTWPEGAPESEASYIYRYTYPQLAGDETLSLTINNIFQYEATDALGFECPMTASDHPAELGLMEVRLQYTITHLSTQSLSVRIDKQVMVGETASHIIKAFTFSLTGANAGRVTSLPYLVGLVKSGESDEWYIDRQTAKADACAREMVWALIEKDMAAEGSPIYGDLTFEEFEWSFYPEEDFYLDADGNLVFFLQAGSIAPAENGHYTYTITLEEMLDEI